MRSAFAVLIALVVVLGACASEDADGDGVSGESSTTVAGDEPRLPPLPGNADSGA